VRSKLLLDFANQGVGIPASGAWQNIDKAALHMTEE
jgi:hypothetical protein